MYLHLGQNTVVRTKDILGIFDIDITTVSKHTRNFLTKSEKNKEVVNVSMELPRSFILCRNKTTTTVYISQLSPKTLLKRKNLSR